MNRFGAFGIHLGISLIIFAILGYLILYHWYPDFFFASDGGWQGIRIVAFVDLVLGPTLTLVVFNRSKPRKELRRDLSIIGIVQLTCLVAGTYVVYSQRPIAMAYADGYFHSLSRDDFLEAGLAVPDLSRFPGSPPKWVSVHFPEDPAEQSVLRRDAMQKGIPTRLLYQLYKPFDVGDIDLVTDGYAAKDLSHEPQVRARLKELTAKHGGSLDEFRLLPFGTRYRMAMIAYRPRDKLIVYLDQPESDE
ncbi:MAG: hypothetical protein PVH91_04895 [Pseudomonadales bacterium]|jgi:hypothetical protein